MDGKIMGFTPPDKFSFDLQRFTLTELVSGADTSSYDFSCEIDGKTYYGTANDFKTGEDTDTTRLGDATKITLLKSFEVNPSASAAPTPALKLSKDCEFDLNGKTLTFGANTPIGIQIADGTTGNKTTFTLKDSSSGGKIKNNYSPGTTLSNLKTNRVYATIQVGTPYTGSRTETSFNNNYGNAAFEMQGGTIESNGTSITASDNSDVSITSGCTVTSNNSCAVFFGDKGNGGGTLTMTGGKLESKGNLPTIQVSGNFSTAVTTLVKHPVDNTKTEDSDPKYSIGLNISGGEVIYSAVTGTGSPLLTTGTGEDVKFAGNIVAIYVGGLGKLDISGDAKVESTGTGVEVRAGALNVTGGTITSTAEKYTVRANDSGSTTFGAAIAISQHTTKQKIDVKVEGINTKITGNVALAVENPQDNNGVRGKISAEIKDATFESTSTEAAAVAAKNSDTSVNINITGDTTFIGNLETTFATTEDSKSAGITIAKDATVTVAKKVLNEETGQVEVVNVATYTNDSFTFTEIGKDEKGEDATLTSVVDEGWFKGKLASNANTVFYLEKKTTGTGENQKINAEATAKLAPASEKDTSEGAAADATLASTTKLELTVENNITADSLAVDMTDSIFGGLSSTFKTFDASDASVTKPIYVIGNANLTAITGGAGDDTLTAVAEDGVTLNGGDGDDSLVGGDGEDTFVYSAGNDVIENYAYSTDKISVTSTEALPVDFKKATFTGSNFVFKFGDSSLQVNDTSNVALLKTNDASKTDTYSYKGHSGGGMDYIAQEGVGISLGAGYTTKNYNGRNRNYQTIDASNVTLTTGIELRANDKDSTVIGASMGGALYGGDGKDYIESGLKEGATAASIKATLDGGSDGNDTLVGTEYGIETFVYRGGNDSISGYTAANGDLISIRGFNPGEATIDKKTGEDEGNTLVLTFDAGTNVLSIAGGADVKGTTEDPAISIQSGNRLYTYTKDYVAYNKGITLASDYSNNEFNGAGEGYTDYVTINAAAVKSNISIVGNKNNNYIVGSTVTPADDATTAITVTLNGGEGNDRFDVSERYVDSKNEEPKSTKYVFEHDSGKDEVFGFNQTNDKLKITADNIKSAKAGNSKLTFTMIGKDNSVVLRGDDDITKVNVVSGADYLTKDGYVATTTKPAAGEGEEGATNTTTLKLFSSAKGRIELGDDPYKTSNINTVDATSVEKQSVTLVGGTQGGTFTYAKDNKKRDGFVYGGGEVTINNYEASKDRIDLNGSTLTSFTVEGDNVKLLLNSASDNQHISIEGAKGKEVLLRNGGSRSFKKMVFVQSGILQNKAKNPTMVTVSAGATGNSSNAEDKTTYTVADSVKKVFVTEDLKTPIKIQAGNKNNTVIDASAAANTVTLSGGKKNDKLIGNIANADTFIYSEGKDIIQNFSANDTISIVDENTTADALASSLSSAKITAGSKSIKFKFTNKNTLTVKANKGESLSGALAINTTNYTYTKNAIANDGAVTLTSAFSGTFKTDDKKLAKAATNVDGTRVEKNLTFKGTADGETLSGGSKKNTFKGGGGNDSLKGGDGKDIFFYAKGDKGETTIANFEFGANKDRLKIASGTIGEISKLENGNVKFAMNSGKKGDTSNIGWFNVEKGTNDIAIKANNTYYWFATEEITDTESGDVLAQKGQLITSDTRVSASDVSGYDIIDLNYSTNLAKSGVAVKVTSKPPTKSNSNS